MAGHRQTQKADSLRGRAQKDFGGGQGPLGQSQEGRKKPSVVTAYGYEDFSSIVTPAVQTNSRIWELGKLTPHHAQPGEARVLGTPVGNWVIENQEAQKPNCHP